jgi:hypothetical protein
VKKKPTPARKRFDDVPYDPRDKAATHAFWKDAIPHTGIAELRAKLKQTKRSK